MRIFWLPLAFASLGYAVGCSAPDSRGHGNNNNGNSKKDMAVSESQSDMAYSEGKVDFANLSNVDLKGMCGIQTFQLQKAGPPNLMIVLDRSSSMGTEPGSSWDEVTKAINAVVPQLQGAIKWGLEFFPTDDDCGVSSTVAVGVATDTAKPIADAITANPPTSGSTPTAEGIHKAYSYLQTLSDPNPKFIVLATDGQPNCDSPSTVGSQTCSCPSPLTADATMTQCCLSSYCIPCSFIPSSDSGAGQAVSDAAKAGVNTYVIGVATGSGDAAVLNDLATKGGTARPGKTKYYEASNQKDFVDAINNIASQIVSCTLALSTAPDNPDLVNVEAGSAVVPRDTTHAEGWDYGPGNTSIIFYGSYCTQLQNGTVTDVAAVFDCPPPT